MLIFHHADSLKSSCDNGLNNIAGFQLLYPPQFHLKRRGAINIWPLMQWLRAYFQLLKREYMRQKTYVSHKDMQQYVFDYTGFFYKPKIKHGNNQILSPINS